jgi:hypothetical protein
VKYFIFNRQRRPAVDKNLHQIRIAVPARPMQRRAAMFSARVQRDARLPAMQPPPECDGWRRTPAGAGGVPRAGGFPVSPPACERCPRDRPRSRLWRDPALRCSCSHRAIPAGPPFQTGRRLRRWSMPSVHRFGRHPFRRRHPAVPQRCPRRGYAMAGYWRTASYRRGSAGFRVEVRKSGAHLVSLSSNVSVVSAEYFR